MLQRPVDAYETPDVAGQGAVDDWLARFGRGGVLAGRVTHRMVRRDFREWLETS